MADGAPAVPNIYVIKKKKHAHGHHGGAWKVAYADFVTAMMALFIVLWLLSSSAEVKKAVGGYFTDPTGKNKQAGSGLAGTGDAITVKKEEMSKIKEKLQEAVKQMPELKKAKDHIQMSVTGEGLRIELLETEKGLFFQSGIAMPSDAGREILSKLAEELGKLPNRILIEGHTDSKPFDGKADYSNWELSADRANAARRLMESAGLKPGQVQQVRGFADQDLRNLKNAEDPANRRVSVIVKYDAPPDAPEPVAGKAGEKKGGAEKGGSDQKVEKAADKKPEPDKKPAEKPAEKKK